MDLTCAKQIHGFCPKEIRFFTQDCLTRLVEMGATVAQARKILVGEMALDQIQSLKEMNKFSKEFDPADLEKMTYSECIAHLQVKGYTYEEANTKCTIAHVNRNKELLKEHELTHAPRVTVGDLYGKSQKEILNETIAMIEQDSTKDGLLTVGNLYGKTRKEIIEMSVV